MTVQSSSFHFEAMFAAVEAAGQSIAPVWPLDRSIAVNPVWEQRSEHISEVAAELGALGGIRCLMPGDYYLRLWQRSVIKNRHLVAAASDQGVTATPEDLLQALKAPLASEHWQNVSDWLDESPQRQNKMAWRDEITHQISQFMADYTQSKVQTGNQPHSQVKPLYQAWVSQARADKGITILMGEPGLARAFQELPDDPGALILAAFSELGVTSAHQAEQYAKALLLDINGWASRLSFERWEARLNGQEEDALPQLVAIRLGWELALWRHWQWRHPQAAKRLQAAWFMQLPQIGLLKERHRYSQQLLWVWQRAAERARQEEEQRLLRSPALKAAPQTSLQAVFCIDVRSEIIRRALESQSPTITTHGFAGFFGLSAAYAPVGTGLKRPQLPGLFSAGFSVTEGGHEAQELGQVRAVRHQQQAAWNDFSRGASTAFSMVEALGLTYAGKLLKRTFGRQRDDHPVNDLATTGHWDLYQGERPLTISEKADIAGQVLKGLGLRRLARSVMLVGHGSHTTNNPHAAGLDCGACGGQTGAINVQVVAQLLNNQAVRKELAERGQRIPDATHFYAALHNTTTDDLDCFGELPEDVGQWLKDATLLAQRERAGNLGLKDQPAFNNPDALDREIRKRAADWSEVRPEWGLAGNSAFIVAPRRMTRGVNFGGRAFLHDYDASLDSDFSILEAIMTAPMVVTHWINMQYNASVTDPLKFGSGNKLLHNVVGGHLGVFEGNGGDLRIGLPFQSVHNGQRWMHEPLRLSVYIAAPEAAISDVIDRHETVRDLVHNEWINLFVLRDNGSVSRCAAHGWEEEINA